jgi:hypothetical protein
MTIKHLDHGFHDQLSKRECSGIATKHKMLSQMNALSQQRNLNKCNCDYWVSVLLKKFPI